MIESRKFVGGPMHGYVTEKYLDGKVLFIPSYAGLGYGMHGYGSEVRAGDHCWVWLWFKYEEPALHLVKGATSVSVLPPRHDLTLNRWAYPLN